jgi:hypothetical protein
VRIYLRCLVCDNCGCPCELIGEHADLWDCMFCGKTYPATPEEAERYKMGDERARTD